MKITRRGARADNGLSSIELKKLKMSTSKEGVMIQDHDIKDFLPKHTTITLGALDLMSSD